MKTLFLVLALISITAHAGFEKLSVVNLDLDYTAPYGKGMVDRVGIGMSLKSIPYPLDITRTEDSFELVTPYLDFSWKHPLKIIYDIEALSLKKTSAALGTKTHFVESEFIMLKTKKNDVYKAEKLKLTCEGEAEGSFDKRLLEDCRKKMHVSIKKVDVPTNFIFARIARELPVPPEHELDIPGDNVIFNMKEGDFTLQAYIKVWFYAGLRIWGHMQYENNHETIAIRVDQIKFGYLPVTSLVMKKLKEIVKGPDVKVDPPWIRIKTKRIYENQ